MPDTHRFGNITGLIAHPDDEVIFLWPMLGHVDKIISIVSDVENPDRAWCCKRREAFAEVGKLWDFEAVTLDYNSGFYRTSTRDEQLKFLLGEVKGAIPDGPLFTHNQFGEYGHIDHMLVHQLAISLEQPVYFVDTVVEANWQPFTRFPDQVRDCYRYQGVFERDQERYDEAERIYRNLGCWTWSRKTPSVCGVYSC